MPPYPSADELRDIQRTRLRTLLDRLPGNPFYSRKFAGLDLAAVRAPADLIALPCTTKAELVADQAAHPPYGSNLARPAEAYSRVHQTSGTASGTPLRWLDTPEGWAGMLSTWRTGFAMMGVTAADRVAFPFSFGPFLGFWTAFEAATQLGALALPLGGLSSVGRLKAIREHAATVVCCTPTYALHLADVAEKEGIDLAGSAVRAVIVAGEPGGGLPAVRAILQDRWGARVFDHYGLTETGPIAHEAADAPGGVFAVETDFIVEVLEPEADQPAVSGCPGELVVTGLVRPDSPLIRYRTGDIVQAGPPPTGAACPWAYFPGGVRGRVDDMIQVRGNNFYPSAVEEVVRRFPQVGEFRIVLDRGGPLANLTVEVEGADAGVRPLEEALRAALHFRVAVVPVPVGSLPRSEMKSRRLSIRND